MDKGLCKRKATLERPSKGSLGCQDLEMTVVGQAVSSSVAPRGHFSYGSLRIIVVIGVAVLLGKSRLTLGILDRLRFG